MVYNKEDTPKKGKGWKQLKATTEAQSPHRASPLLGGTTLPGKSLCSLTPVPQRKLPPFMDLMQTAFSQLPSLAPCLWLWSWDP